MRDKTKNHIVNQKQAKNKTRNTHKKKLTAKEKLKININKQEPETKKNHMPDCKAVTSESRPHFMPRGIFSSWQPEVRLVSRTQLETSFFQSKVGAISFFVSKWQQIAMRWDLARTPSRTSAPVSVNRFWFIAPIWPRPYTNT